MMHSLHTSLEQPEMNHTQKNTFYCHITVWLSVSNEGVYERVYVGR